MVPKASIEFIRAEAPSTDLVTKFGGQPVWYDRPKWPLSRQLGTPMQFICQIALDSKLFPAAVTRMAYLFMTDDDSSFVDGTWLPDGGENAIILQPGSYDGPVAEHETGPTLYEMVEKAGHERLVPEPIEYLTKLTPGADRDFLSEEERWNLSDQEQEEMDAGMEGNKIGGTPLFLQSDEFPSGGPWKLLLQLDATKVPFYLNFGDAGVGFGFINETGTIAKFLWQCC